MNKTIELTHLRKVESSNINQVGFHNDSIFVQFKNGSVYSYLNASVNDYDALVNADSVGRHLNTNIKGKFEYKKLECDLSVSKKEKTILEAIDIKIKKAMKDKDLLRSSALKLLKSEIINNKKSKKPLKELDVVRNHHKKLKKSLDFFTGPDVLNLELEIKVVEEFLPKEMSDEELVKFIDNCFKIHLNYDDLSVGEIIKKIKHASGSSNGKLIAKEVKKYKNMAG